MRSRDFASTASMLARSPASSATPNTRALSAICCATPSRVPTITPATAGTIENVANAHVGNTRLMLLCNRFQRAEQFLEQRPSSPRINHVAVLLQRRGIEIAAMRRRTPEVFFRQQPAEHGAIGEQCYVVIATECRHRGFGTAID